MLVGHPLTALERELKRLVVREELEKEQLRIIKLRKVLWRGARKVTGKQ